MRHARQGLFHAAQERYLRQSRDNLPIRFHFLPQRRQAELRAHIPCGRDTRLLASVHPNGTPRCILQLSGTVYSLNSRRHDEATNGKLGDHFLCEQRHPTAEDHNTGQPRHLRFPSKTAGSLQEALRYASAQTRQSRLQRGVDKCGIGEMQPQTRSSLGHRSPTAASCPKSAAFQDFETLGLAPLLYLLSLTHRLPLQVAGAGVDGVGADDAVAVELLDHVGGPACGSADGEDGGEQLGRDADSVED